MSMLKGKTALVTGSTSGIGLGIAVALARQGANIVLNGFGDVDAPKAQVQEAGKAAGIKVGYHGADMSKAAEIEAMMKYAAAEFGRVDILVNNAGNAGWVGFKDATPDSWDTLMAVYARAPFFIVQAALSRLADGGRIINISSAAATKPVTAAPIYSMAKAAINNLTHALASELGPRGITANAVAPGFTRTDANAAFRENPELVKAIEAQIALGRFGEPSEIAAVVAFLASDDGHWVTGQTIEASGGYRL